MEGLLRAITLAISSSSAVPLAPSFAPLMGWPRLSASASSSAVGRVSQWARRRMRSGESGLKRAKTLES
jgi:hypothetical protein